MLILMRLPNAQIDTQMILQASPWRRARYACNRGGLAFPLNLPHTHALEAIAVSARPTPHTHAHGCELARHASAHIYMSQSLAGKTQHFGWGAQGAKERSPGHPNTVPSMSSYGSHINMP